MCIRDSSEAEQTAAGPPSFPSFQNLDPEQRKIFEQEERELRKDIRAEEKLIEIRDNWIMNQMKNVHKDLYAQLSAEILNIHQETQKCIPFQFEQYLKDHPSDQFTEKKLNKLALQYSGIFEDEVQYYYKKLPTSLLRNFKKKFQNDVKEQIDKMIFEPKAEDLESFET